MASANSEYVDDPGGTRTRDPRIKSAMLYRLSYRVVRANSEFYSTARAYCIRLRAAFLTARADKPNAPHAPDAPDKILPCSPN